MTFSFGKIISTLEHGFVGFFKGLWAVEAPQVKQFEANIIAFVKTDVGQLALDAIALAPTLAPAGADGLAIRSAAEAKLAADLIKAGKDATVVTTTSVQLFVATAYAYAKTVVTNLSATTQAQGVATGTVVAK